MLDLPLPPDGGRLVGSAGDVGRCWIPISSGGPSWKETCLPASDWGRGGVGLNRSGLARGRLERRGGAEADQSRTYVVSNLAYAYLRHLSGASW